MIRDQSLANDQINEQQVETSVKIDEILESSSFEDQSIERE